MPKYLLKEGIVEKFFSAILNSILQRRQRQVMKVLEKDPQLKALYQNLDQSAAAFRSYFDTNYPNGEKMADLEAMLRDTRK